MHYTGLIPKISYGLHLTVFVPPSPLPKFTPCTFNLQVAPAHLCVCYANTDIHWYPEVTPESFILDSKFKISSFRVTKVSQQTSKNNKKELSGFLELLPDINRCQCLHNKRINGLVQQAYQAYTVYIVVNQRRWWKLSEAIHNLCLRNLTV